MSMNPVSSFGTQFYDYPCLQPTNPPPRAGFRSSACNTWKSGYGPPYDCRQPLKLHDLPLVYNLWRFPAFHSDRIYILASVLDDPPIASPGRRILMYIFGGALLRQCRVSSVGSGIL